MTSKKWSAKDASRCIITPSSLDHKYSRGTLGVITGSAQYPGAAVLTTSAALATGLGALRFHSSSGLAHLVLHQSPEVLVQPGPVTAWLAGSGIHHKKYSDVTTWLRHRWFALLSRQNVPTILDAGALHAPVQGHARHAQAAQRVREPVRVALQLLQDTKIRDIEVFHLI